MQPIVYPKIQVSVKCLISIRYCWIYAFRDWWGPCKNDPKISPLNVILRPFPSEHRLFPHPLCLSWSCDLWKKCDASSGFNSPMRVYICCIWGVNTTCAEAQASLLRRRHGGALRLAGRQPDLSVSPSWVIWTSSDPSLTLDMQPDQKTSAELPRPESSDHRTIS